MRIDFLELINFKAFEQFRLELHPEFNLIVGVNRFLGCGAMWSA